MQPRIRVTGHAIRRYAERILGAPLLRHREYHRIATMISRSLVSAIAVALSPMQRAIFADRRWGVNPNDEFRLYRNVIFVLSRPPRGGDATCVTVFVATPAQLQSIRSTHEEEECRDAFCAALADYFNLEDREIIERVRLAIARTPRTLNELLALLPAITAESGANLDRVGARYFWSAYVRARRAQQSA